MADATHDASGRWLLPVLTHTVDGSGNAVPVTPGYAYETVAAGQTSTALGATGATGDYLSHVILMPGATTAGTTLILDNVTTIFTYTAGTLSDLRPIVVPFGTVSVSGAWKVTTGASMTVIGVGKFT